MTREAAWRLGSGIALRVRLTPRADRDALEGFAQSGEQAHLKARVRAVPEGGRANTALVRLIADAMETAISEIRLVTGTTSRIKTLEISGRSDELMRRLEKLVDA